MKDRDADWDSLDVPQPDRLLSAKRGLEALDQQRAGYDPDWKLRVVMLREAREERRSGNHSRAARRQWAEPERRRSASETRAAAWQAGKYYAQRGVARKPERTEQMLALRADGLTNQEIADALGITYGAVWLRIGGQRKKPHRLTVTRDEIVALRAKGLSWERVALMLGCSPRAARERVLGKPQPLAKCGAQ